ncbi:MAG: pyridoxal phosphate-dependent aminotransferase [Candidatus Omnitrophica bacterium]|nr:pyridoxal phosphate-dependent aminotransferase [Candidatus Omnitrophota bacterium]
MKLAVSKRSALIVQSEIRNMSIECDRIDGLNLSQGVCDLSLPMPVKNGAKQALDAGLNQYTRYDGIDELRRSIAKKLKQYNHILAHPDKNIVVSCGATGAFYSACLALLNPGDEVIIFEPYYGYHVNTLLAANTKPVFVKLTAPDWIFSLAELKKHITKKTRGIMVNTPANPSGKVFSRQELEDIAQVALKHDLFIFTDEIYEYFIYDGLKHISPGSLPEIKDRTISISGYSKTFSITGWRVGYCVCDEKWAKMIGYINDLIYVCAPAPLQFGVFKGIESLPDKFYSGLCQEYLFKRNKICRALEMAGLIPFIPKGAYYVLANASRLPGPTSKDKAMFLLKKTGVASVPGEAFYHDQSGKDILRFCFAKKDSVLDEACRRLIKLKKRIK